MNDVLGRFMGYTLALFVFMLSVVLIIVDYQSSIQEQVGQQVVNFVNECRETGVVNADDYTNLVWRVAVYGRYNMQFKIEQKKEYSEYDSSNRLVTRTGFETVDPDAFGEAMGEGHNFTLKAGDRVSVKVTEGEGNFATKMKKAVTFADQSKNVIINYGGTVGE